MMPKNPERELTIIVLVKGGETQVQDVLTAESPSKIVADLILLNDQIIRVLILDDSSEAEYRLIMDSEHDFQVTPV